MCVLSIKVPIGKKSGNLFKDPPTIFHKQIFHSIYTLFNECIVLFYHIFLYILIMLK